MERIRITDAEQLYTLFENVVVDFPEDSDDEEEVSSDEEETYVSLNNSQADGKNKSKCYIMNGVELTVSMLSIE